MSATSKLYHSVFSHARDGIIITDARGVIQDVNPGFTAITGYTSDEAIGQLPRFLKSDHHPRKFYQDMLESLQEHGCWEGEIWNRRKNGEEFPEWLSIHAIHDEATGEVTHFVASFSDERLSRELKARLRMQKQLEAANERLRALAHLDPLTSLLNRRGLQTAFWREQRRARRNASSLLVLLVDLDDFKRINDTLGHAMGDVVLKEVAARLQSSLRGTDYVARIGSDEFMILLPDTRPVQGLPVAEKVRMALSGGPISISPAPVTVTGSIGLLQVTGSRSTIDDLLAETHLVLQRSKREGKNRVSCAWWKTGAPNAPGVTVTAVVDALREPGSLRAMVHPIHDLEDGQIAGYEFLARSNVPGFEMPDDFFRVCSEAGVLGSVDLQCFFTCLGASASYDHGARCHVNLFPSTLINTPVGRLIDAFPTTRPASSYCMELSEQQIIGDSSQLVDAVRALKRAGVRIAIDDVGFGRSWLESLILLEPQILKIDRALVTGVGHDTARRRRLVRLLRMAESLEAEVVAEGVEDRDDLEVVRSLGVRYAQGFHWEQPTAVRAAEA